MNKTFFLLVFAWFFLSNKATFDRNLTALIAAMFLKIRKTGWETLQTVQPSIIEDQPATGSSWDTASDDEDPFWN